MADQIKKLSAGHSIEVLDAIMTEVEEARGEYESLDARLDEISGEGYSKAEVDALLALKQNALNSAQLAAVNSGINSEKVEQIESNKNNISKDRAALIELVDGGAKNALENTATTNTVNGVTFTINSDKTVTVDTAGNAATANTFFALDTNLTELVGKQLILSGCPVNEQPDDCYLFGDKTDGTYFTTDKGNTSGVVVIPSNCRRIGIFVRSGTIIDNLIFYPMLCTKAAWDISQAYQPYRPSYQELYEMVKALQAAT